MTNVLKISSHDELIASIPHTLGFTPQGMVCRAFGGGPTARLDIPESPAEMDEFLQLLSDVYVYPSPAVSLCTPITSRRSNRGDLVSDAIRRRRSDSAWGARDLVRGQIGA